MKLSDYDNRLVQLADPDGHIFTGVAKLQDAEYCMREFGREEDSVRINGRVIYASGITNIKERPDLKILRASETWQQAGAYYVRIQAMAKKHHITLRQEFDEHDDPETKYIVVTDNDFPIATARMYPLDKRSVMIGRVVVLPEYRHQGIGRMVVCECEVWAEELGYSKAVVESRDNKIGFYLGMDYEIRGEMTYGETFRYIRMEKELCVSGAKPVR